MTKLVIGLLVEFNSLFFPWTIPKYITSFLSKIFSRNKDEQPSNIYKQIIEKSVDICFLNYQDPKRIAEEIEKLTDNKNDALMLYLFIYPPHILPNISA